MDATVVSLDVARRRRQGPPVRALRTVHRPQQTLHPSLRWCAGDAYYVAHRREDGGAACGATGDLVLAPPGVPECRECFATG